MCTIDQYCKENNITRDGTKLYLGDNTTEVFTYCGWEIYCNPHDTLADLMKYLRSSECSTHHFKKIQSSEYTVKRHLETIGMNIVLAENIQEAYNNCKKVLKVKLGVLVGYLPQEKIFYIGRGLGIVPVPYYISYREEYKGHTIVVESNFEYDYVKETIQEIKEFIYEL